MIPRRFGNWPVCCNPGSWTVGIDLSVIALQDVEGLSWPLQSSRATPNGGLVVTASPFGANHPDVVAALAARYKLPAVYPFRYFIGAGGLISYGADLSASLDPRLLTLTASLRARAC